MSPNPHINLLFSTSYLPPIKYISKLHSAISLTFEAHEHFVKQTIRNRCHILSPNGIQTLIVPVEHSNRFHIPIKDLRIANDQSWQRQHWRSLCSAYQRSAFFEFYQDDIVYFYEKKQEFLLDFNLELLIVISSMLNDKLSISKTEKYELPDESNSTDLRYLSNLSIPDADGDFNSYPQVFGYKNGFVSGLSIVDLLFNMGPASVKYF